MTTDLQGFPGASAIAASILSPASLFTAGQKGFWLEASDPSQLWQNTGGTTPVAANGDPVARADDKSGNGYSWQQATGANQPTWNTDSAGYKYLNFDGSNDVLATTGNVDLSGSDKLTIVLAVDRQSASNKVAVDNNYGAAGGWAIYAAAGSSNEGPALLVTGTTNGYKYAGREGLGKFMLSGRIDISQSAIASEIDCRINGRPFAMTSDTGGLGTGNFSGSYKNYLGAVTGGGFYFLGKFYFMMVIQGLLSDADLIAVENYANTKIGIW